MTRMKTDDLIPTFASDLQLKEGESQEQLDISRAPEPVQAALDVAREFPEDMPRHRHESRERGNVYVQYLTMRDIGDAFNLALWQSMGIAQEDWPESIYDIPLQDLDPVAIRQNLLNNVEAHMGIYPNHRDPS